MNKRYRWVKLIERTDRVHIANDRAWMKMTRHRDMYTAIRHKYWPFRAQCSKPTKSVGAAPIKIAGVDKTKAQVRQVASNSIHLS